MSTQIVVVNTSVQNAPAPNLLQQTGALISQGGTNTVAGTLTLLTSAASLTAITPAAKAVTTTTWSASVVTITTTAPHGWTNGDVIPIIIAGATPAAYNGAFTGTVTGASTVTYPLVANPGVSTVQPTIQLGAVAELNQMVTTYFAQQIKQAVYVLELGEGTPVETVPVLTTFMTNNPKTIYSYLVPRNWDNISGFLSLANTYATPSSETYFFVTTTVAHRAVYAGMKNIFALVESPNAGALEFQCAGPFNVTLGYAPSSANKVPPLSYAFVYGITPYPTVGNQTTLQQLATANVNWIGTGAEGGISTSIIFQGNLSDGNPFNYWYAADWVQINIDLNLANEVINGSNTTINPLYYNQRGIDRLQNRAVKVLGAAIAAGLGNGTVKAVSLPAAQFTLNYENGLYVGFIVINAEPFLTYQAENPGSYAAGNYGGIQCVFTPLRGFLQVIFNLSVTNIIV